MKKLKRLAGTILAIVLCLGEVGCMNTRESTYDKMINLMNEKYPEDTFYYSAPYGGGLLSGNETTKMICTSEKFPDSTIYVSYNRETGKLINNYLRVKYLDDVNALIKRILVEAYPEGTVYYEPDVNIGVGSGTGEIASNATFEEFISNSDADLSLLAYVELSDDMINQEKLTEELEQILRDNKACFSLVRIWFFNGKEYDDQLSSTIYDDRWNVIAKDYYDYYLYATMDNYMSFSELEWETK